MKLSMPAGNPQSSALRQHYDSLRVRFDRFISGRAPSDPLYLTNRTWQQKLKIAGLAAIPVVILVALVLIGATDVFRVQKADPYEHPLAETQPSTPREPLPEPKIAAADLEVVNIHITKDAKAPAITGTVRNNTNAKVDSAQISYYLADHGGSLLGTDTADVRDVRAHGSVAFRIPLKMANAEYIIVRDVRPN